MHTHPLRRGMTSDSLTHSKNSLVNLTAGHWTARAHTHTHTRVRHLCVGQKTAKCCCDEAACAFKFHDPLFTAGAGWQGALVLAHAALNNWNCKVNVRRTAKWREAPSVPSLGLPALLSAGCAPAGVPAALSWSQCCSHRDGSRDQNGQMKMCIRWNQSGGFTISTHVPHPTPASSPRLHPSIWEGWMLNRTILSDGGRDERRGTRASAPLRVLPSREIWSPTHSIRDTRGQCVTPLHEWERPLVRPAAHHRGHRCIMGKKDRPGWDCSVGTN